MKVVREHDKLYLKENRKDKTKEYFKFINSNASSFLSKLNGGDILDVGCATGDFIYYIKNNYPQFNFHGMDVMESLLERAREEVPDVNFFNSNIASSNFISERQYDGVFMSGVSGIFDDLQPWFDNVIKSTKKGGEIYIFGLFNPYDQDVIIKSRKSGSESNEWETGWNTFSIKTYEKVLDKKSLNYEFIKFEIDVDLDHKEDDHLRSWTRKLSNGKREILNGLLLVHEFYLLKIKVEKP